MSLAGESEYPFIGGDLVSTDGVHHREDAYLEMTNEYVVPDNTSKWCKLSRESMAVGALARFNLNAERLGPLARETAAKLGLEHGCTNPYMNSVAQLVETVQVVERSLSLIDELLAAGIQDERPLVTPRAGTGVGCVEAPRGIDGISVLPAILVAHLVGHRRRLLEPDL